MGKLCATNITSDVKCGSCGKGLAQGCCPTESCGTDAFKVGHRPSCWDRIRSFFKMFVKVSRWKVSGTNKFMTSSNFDEFRTCEMSVHFHLLVFEFDCLHQKKWKTPQRRRVAGLGASEVDKMSTSKCVDGKSVAPTNS